jgi:hypothetical protein
MGDGGLYVMLSWLMRNATSLIVSNRGSCNIIYIIG